MWPATGGCPTGPPAHQWRGKMDAPDQGGLFFVRSATSVISCSGGTTWCHLQRPAHCRASRLFFSPSRPAAAKGRPQAACSVTSATSRRGRRRGRDLAGGVSFASSVSLCLRGESEVTSPDERRRPSARKLRGEQLFSAHLRLLKNTLWRNLCLSVCIRG